MNTRFFASRCGVILAAAGLAIVSTTPSFANAPNSQTTQTAVEPTNSIESTDQLAQNLLLEDDTVDSLPDAIAEAVLEDIIQRTGLSVSDLTIMKVAQQTWTDGCLGLDDGICTQALVPGWQVIVANDRQMWAYRTDESGSLVKLDEELSQKMTSRVMAFRSNRQEVMTRTQTTRVSTSTTTQPTAPRTSQTQVSQRFQTSFRDIASNYWARDFIAELARQGIISGFPDGLFRPNEPVTRAQFAAMLRKAFEKNSVRNAINFRDISRNYWAYSAVREAFEMGFLGVDSGNRFNPNQPLSRLEVLMALTQGLNYSYNGSIDSVLSLYSDAADIPPSVRSLVAAATQRGIVVNYPNVQSFSPNRVATRAEVAAFLYQALVSTGQMVEISSPYVVITETEIRPSVEMEGEVEVEQRREVEIEREREIEVEGEREDVEVNKPRRQNCNQGIGNGAEGCDPGNSRPHGGSNDEGGRTPGGRNR